MAGKRERGDEDEKQLLHDVMRLVRLVQAALRASAAARSSIPPLRERQSALKAPDQRIVVSICANKQLGNPNWSLIKSPYALKCPYSV